MRNGKMELLTTAEEYVAVTVWDALPEKLSATDILERVNANFNRNWKPQTVSTFLQRLITKEYLYSFRKGRVFYYVPMISKNTYANIKLAMYCELYGVPSKEALNTAKNYLELHKH